MSIIAKLKALIDPMTTRGDMIRRGSTGAERFAAVTDNRVVAGDGTDVVLKQIDDPAFFAAGAYNDGTNAGTLPIVTSMSDSLATQLGHKTYFHGTTYAGSSAPTVSGTNWTTGAAAFIPYQMQNNTWWLRVQINGTLSGLSNNNSASISINAVTFKNNSLRQAGACWHNSTSLTNNMSASATPNAATIAFTYAGGAVDMNTTYSVSGDFELEGKPTWAY